MTLTSQSTPHSFSILNIPPAQLANLEQLGYSDMTPIQAMALPAILAGNDIIAKAKTGSGKTAAFGIGILESIQVNIFQTQCLVLCPTRELATQVSQELRRLARYLPNVKITTLCGGIPKIKQDISLMRPAHIIVGTPGRIFDHLSKNTLKLNHLKTWVLDEADRMLDMGFSEVMDSIIEYIPKNRQTLLFSATYPDQIAAMSAKIQTKPIHIAVESHHDIAKISQLFFAVTRSEKLAALYTILAHFQPESCLIFCNTKRETQVICDALMDKDISALALNGDLEQRERDQVLVRFSNGSCRILVATDVAARGLDIKALSMVINYDIALDAETHIHRIGRTGRAGLEGHAISLYHDHDRHRLDAIEANLKTQVIWGDLQALDCHHIEKNNKNIESKKLTLRIEAGRKAKIRAGDILGALTGDLGLQSDDIGKIDLFDMYACVAITDHIADRAFSTLKEIKIKGRYVYVHILE